MNNSKDQTQDSNKSSQKKKRYIITFIISVSVVSLILYLFLAKRIPGLSAEKSSFDKIKNVIFITLDTVRSDYLSCYRKGNADTPNMDYLAQEGVLFEKCISQTPLTLPEHVTILSGTYPLHHGVRDNGGFQVPEKLELISEVFQKKGYATSAFIGAYVLHSKWGIDQGFDNYSDAFDLGHLRTSNLEVEKPADVVLGDAQKWILEHKEQPFFTWIHLFDPHAPYTPPSPYDKKYPDNPYAGEIEYTDAQLGYFFKFLRDQGLYDSSMIIITADHGEGLWDHEERTHGIFVYQSTVWVPLIIRLPSEFPKKKIDRIVEHVDIAPTVLDILDIPIPDSYQGESLLPLMMNHDSPKEEIAYTETFYPRLHMAWSELQSFYYKDWKYIRAPKDELYNLSRDKTEKNNLVREQLSLKKETFNKMLKFVRDKSQNALPPVKIQNVDEKDRRRLETLGYITTTPSTVSNENLPDPKEKLPELKMYEKADVFLKEGKYEEAIRLSGELLAEEPNNVDVLNLRGVAYLKNGQLKEAIEHFYKLLKQRPDYNSAMINVVEALLAEGDIDRAIEEIHRFLSVFPEDNILYALLGDALFFQHKFDQALENLQKSIKLEESNSKALSRIGDIYFIKKDYSNAESYFKRALAINPQVKNANFGMAMLKETQGNTQEAKEYYKKELEHNNENRYAAFNLAELLRKNGTYDQAIPHYRQAIKIDPQFKLPYLMIARYFLEKGQNLEEGIRLCKIGIKIQPADEITLMGYFILTNIYAKLGDMKNTRFYSQEGEKLYKTLENRKVLGGRGEN